MATESALGEALRWKSETGFSARQPSLPELRTKPRTWLRASLCALGLLVGANPANGASNKVRITGLSDVSFGTVSNLSVDAVQSQSLCLYANTDTNGYNITAIGIGPGGGFVLISGANPLPFDVAWSSSAGQSSGTAVTPNLPLTGQVSTATHQTCSGGPATTASLVIVLRAAALSIATAGTYNGTLTLVVGPE